MGGRNLTIASILLVDDEPIVLVHFKEMLDARGYVLAGAVHSGVQALEAARTLKPDLVLMDIVMPGELDGVAACARIQDECDIPVVLLTAYADAATLARIRECQPYGYLLKPAAEVQIAAVIEVALQRKERERTYRRGLCEFTPEGLLHQIIESSQTGIVLYNAAGHITFANDCAKQLLRLERATSGQGCYRTPSWNDLQGSLLPFDTILATLHPLRNQRCAFIDPLGAKLVLDVSGAPLFSPPGDLEGVAFTLLDVTAQDHALEALKHSETRYRAIVEDQSELICRYWPDGRISFANNSYCRYYGTTIEAILDTTFVPNIPEPDLTQIRQALAGLSPHQPSVVLEHRILRSDGQINWQNWTHRGIFNAEGGVLEFQAVGRDVTKRKLAEEKLARAEKNLRDIFEHAQEGIFQLSPEGVLLNVNPAMARMLDLTDAEGTDLHGSGGFYDDFLKLIEVLQAQDRATDYSIELRRPEAPPLYLSCNARSVRNNAGLLLYVEGLVEDVTTHKRMEDELRAAVLVASEANEAKSRFLATMSHEIRTPMNAIVGLSEILLQTSLKGEQRDYVETIVEATHHLLTVINDILDISKIESRKIELERLDFDLHQRLQSTLRTMSLQARKKGLELMLNIASDVPRVLKGDPARLRQVLINLVANAIKFTEKGMVRVDVDLDKATQPEARAVLRFQVTDTGMGIAADKLGSIFDPFGQADSSITRTHGGTGLGLAISKALVEIMDGTIIVESAPDAGSVFTFTVCLAQGDPGKLTEEKHQVESFSADHIPLKILLVEDNPVNVKVGTVILRRLGHTLATAAHGKEALSLLEEEAFDLVLMDLEMPVMDGLEATRRIRAGEAGESNRTIPIVALTAHALSGYREQCLEAGMSHYVSKPVDFQELAAVLDRIALEIKPLVCVLAQPDEPKPVDKDIALRRLGGDEDLLYEVWKIFSADAPRRVEQLGQAVQACKLEDVAFHAHSLKGMAATVGAGEASALAEAIETAAKARKTNGLSSAYELLARAFEASLRSIEEIP